MPKARKSPETESLNSKENIALLDDLRHFGYLLPTDDEEYEEFEKIFGSTKVIFPERLKDNNFLHQSKKVTEKFRKLSTSSLKQEQKNQLKKGTKSDYFKKIVLAAEIANELYTEPTFGHKKFVKILYLCQEVCDMNLSTNYRKFIAGPLDPKYMYSIDSEFKNQGWFKTEKRDDYGYKYVPLKNVDKYKQYYLRYFSRNLKDIAQLIDLFRRKDSAFCEIVTTLYAIWKELIRKKSIVSEALLCSEFYDWSKAKESFSKSQIIKCIEWMKQNEITPYST